MKTLLCLLVASLGVACTAPSASRALPSPTASAVASASDVPTSDAGGRRCGGWSAGRCPSTYRCVDDPNQHCSYERSDDCTGICLQVQ